MGFSPLLTLLLFFMFSVAWASSGVTYHGRILKPDDSPVTSATTQFRIQIRTPGSENCLLWEEQQTKNLSTTNGVFSITINDTSEPSLVSNVLPYSLDRVFSNRTNFTGLTGCSVGTTYNPTGSDGRHLTAYFREVPTDPWEQMPVTKVNFVPLSLNTMQLQGYQASEFLKVDPLSSYTPLTPTQVNTLLDLVTAAPTLNQILKFNGTNWVPAADDTGTAPVDASYAAKGIVQFDTNLATSGVSVTAGVASLPNTIVAGGPIGSASTVPILTYDNKGRLTAVSTSAVDDTTKLPLGGGTMTGGLNMGAQNITNATSVAATNFSGRNLILSDNDANTVTVRTPTDITANYVLQLPADNGTNGQVLSTDGSGVLSWITSSGGVTGTGTTNTLPKWTSATALGNSVLSESSGTVTLNGNLNLPNSTSSVGVITFSGSRHFHKYGSQNTFIGEASGNFTTTGSFNNSLGYATLINNTSGSGNVAVGDQAMRYNTTGFSNTAVGADALAAHTTGRDNSALGNGSLAATTSGESNTGLGKEAARSVTTGFYNVAGGPTSLANITTGSSNVALGKSAGYYANTSSSDNIFIGDEAGPSASTTLSNTLWINNENGTPLIYGDFATDRVGINKTNPGYALDVTGDIQATGCLRSSAGVASGVCTSDERLKSNIEDYSYGLEEVLKLQPRKFTYNGLGLHPRTDEKEVGLVAQEVEKAAPHLVVETDRSIDGEKIKAVNYTELIYMTVNAIKELDRKNKELEAELQKLKASCQ